MPDPGPVVSAYDRIMAKLLAHSISLHAARRMPGEDYTRLCSESHLAGMAAYLLWKLSALDEREGSLLGGVMAEWDRDGQGLAEWVADTAGDFGVDAEALIVEATTPVPAPDGAGYTSDAGRYTEADAARRITGLTWEPGQPPPEVLVPARGPELLGLPGAEGAMRLHARQIGAEALSRRDADAGGGSGGV